MAKQTAIYSGAYLADVLGTTRETVFRQVQAGRIESPAYQVHGPGGKSPTGAWSAAQVERIRKTWEPGKPGRPPRVPPRGGGPSK